jgi:para-nitrobenzyl esterase
MYEFAWRSPAFEGRLGACHALDLRFVFDTVDKGREQMMGGSLGDHPPQQLADTMHAAWVRFARDGDLGWPRFADGTSAPLGFTGRRSSTRLPGGSGSSAAA